MKSHPQYSMHMVVFCAITVIGLHSTAFARDAENIAGRWGIGANVSAAIPEDDEGNANASEIYLGGELIYGFTNNIAVSADAGYISFEQEDGAGTDIGDANAVPVFANLIYRYPIGITESVIYAKAGLGAIFWDVDESSTLTSAGAEIDVDNAFAVRLGGGLEFFINESAAIFAEGSYIFSETTAELNVGSSTLVAQDTDTDFWMVGGGFRYYFS